MMNTISLTNGGGAFGDVISFVIIGLAIATFVGFIYVVSKVNKLNADIENERRKKRGRTEFTGKGITQGADVYTWEDTLVYLETFNKIQLTYSMVEQIIPIFPLLGILGTVGGLIQQFSQGIDELYAGLSTAMYTTFYGLIAAIILKILDALWVSKVVNKRALSFEMFKENYQMAKDKYDQTNEEQ